LTIFIKFASVANDFFQFKQFTIHQYGSIFKVGTDGVILGAYADVSGAKRILDIGSGTGLIAIMLAQRSEAEIIALEPVRDAFRQLVENIEACKWKDRITPINKSLQEYMPDSKFDLIISNPPYFINSLRNPDSEKSFSRHNDNLSHYDLLTGISELLDQNGRFQVIMPFAEGNVFIAEAAGYGLYCNNILKIRPLPTSEIRRLVLTFSRDKTKPTEKFLTIEHGPRQQFTEEYKSLMKDFYLKL
jgi:tRNA1Val (adenine37-N6)-methyltransferase